jgi:hypothetical protein
MKNSTKNSGLKVKTSVKAGIIRLNHNRAALASKKAGLQVKTSVKAGLGYFNHNHVVLR